MMQLIKVLTRNQMFFIFRVTVFCLFCYIVRLACCSIRQRNVLLCGLTAVCSYAQLWDSIKWHEISITELCNTLRWPYSTAAVATCQDSLWVFCFFLFLTSFSSCSSFSTKTSDVSRSISICKLEQKTNYVTTITILFRENSFFIPCLVMCSCCII